MPYGKVISNYAMQDIICKKVVNILILIDN